MTWVAVAVVGGTVIGSVASGAIGASGAESAAATQAAGQEQAAATQEQMFNTIVGQEQPFLESGMGASSALNFLLGTADGYQELVPGVTPGSYGTVGFSNAGTPAAAATGTGRPGYDPSSGYTINPGGGVSRLLPGGTPAGGGAPQAPAAGAGAPQGSALTLNGLPQGYLSETFNPTLSQLVNYPGFQFSLDLGNAATQNANAPGLGALSGPAQEGLSQFNQGLAQSYYNNYFDQFQTGQNNIFNRLSQIASLGQNAAGNVGNNGAQLGSGIASAQAAAAGSQAAGTVGATNAITGAINSASGSIPLGVLLANQGSTAGAAAAENPAVSGAMSQYAAENGYAVG